jgi:DNA-binding NarL/FixJ family response regulator
MRVVIGDDESLLRAGLEHVLAVGGFDLAAAATNATELVALTRKHRPDLVVTDIRMPPHRTDDGLQAALTIRTEFPGQPVVLLSQHLLRRYAAELLTSGMTGLGYLLKQRVGAGDAFCADLRRVAAGGTALDPEVVELMMTSASTPGSALTALTGRQRDVLGLMAEGRSNEAIARSLFITEGAVVKQVSNIYDILGLPAGGDENRRVLAVLRFLAEQ